MREKSSPLLANRLNLWRIVPLCGCAIWVEGRNDHGCAFFEETTVLGVALSISAPGFGFLVYKLSQVNDAFKLRREFTWILLVVLPLTCERTHVAFVVRRTSSEGVLKHNRRIKKFDVFAFTHESCRVLLKTFP